MRLKGERTLKFSGHFELHISNDEMLATADFYPPERGGEYLASSQVENELKSNSISYGVKRDNIEKRIEECAQTGKAVKEVLIAQGLKPENHVPTHFRIKTELLNKKFSLNSKEHRVDYREWSPFYFVQKGDVLAYRVKESQGREGKTITAQTIPFRVEKVIELQTGENVVVEEDKFTAACDGRFISDGKAVAVHEVLDLKGNVDYSTGNIDFTGDVIIHGTVEDGFKVHSKGSLFCEETLNATEIIGDENLVTKNGIVGRGKGVVRIHGSIKTKFIENCYIEALGLVEVQRAIINSCVYSLDSITLDRSGKIIGGVIVAQKGVETDQLGNEMGIDTLVSCGIDFQVQRKLRETKEKLQEIAQFFSELENKSATEAQLEKKRDKIDELKELKGKLLQQAKELEAELCGYEQAQVLVKGAVYPGTHVEICNVAYIVEEKLNRVSFHYNKETGKVEVS